MLPLIDNKGFEADGTEVPPLFTKPDIEFPDLDHFQYGTLETISAPESVSASLDLENLSSCSSVEDDVWDFATGEVEQSKPNTPKTWERFYDKTFRESSKYFSEAGPSAFDAAVQRFHGEEENISTSKPASLVVRSDPLLAALAQLGLGRESLIFQYQAFEQSFRPRYRTVRMSGYTPAAFESLTARFIRHGNQMRNLRSLIQQIYGGRKACPTVVAVAAGVSSALNALTIHLGSSTPTAQSVLQLQSTLCRPSQVLDCLTELTGRLEQHDEDVHILTKLYQYAQEKEHAETWLQSIVHSILARVSEPWLNSISASIGLPSGRLDFSTIGQRSLGFLSQLAQPRDDEGLDARSIPAFIPDSDRQTIQHTCHGLRLLEKYQPDHVLTSAGCHRSKQPPNLIWLFGWADIERIQSKARQYEVNILSAMASSAEFDNSSHQKGLHTDIWDSPDVSPFGESKETMKDYISQSRSSIERPWSNSRPPSKNDHLTHVILDSLDVQKETSNEEDVLVSPLSLTPIFSFSPVISVQARLVNLACLRMLFKGRGLRAHLSLQKRYHLFGDGVFASRLSQALFDPQLQSAERRKGHSRTGVMGLKLGTRDTWPPASSELRLALMGILTESYKSSDLAKDLQLADGELPGGLSFAIRDLDEEDIQKCLDPDSIHALDFLRLQYRPPPPLDVVITTSCLDKYDAIFRLLLRMTRLLFVVNHLAKNGRSGFTDARSSKRANAAVTKFRIEAHHFISTICAYFMDVGVGANWHRYENDLVDLDRQLDGGTTASDLGKHASLQQIQKSHEEWLETIMFSLLLRKRQEQVMRLLEEIFSLVLLFAKREGLDGSKEPTSVHDHYVTLDLYYGFRKKVGIFINVCRGLSQKKWHSTGQGTGQSNHGSFGDRSGNTIDQLLLKLDMNGYYSRLV